MNDALKEQTVGSSDAPRDEGQQEDWDLYTAHYPKSRVRIPMLRVLGWNDDCRIVEVTNLSKNEGRIIAECDFNEGAYGPYFTTTTEHRGHLALCRFLLRMGIGGRYKDYLNAVNQNNNTEAEEWSSTSMIRFSLELTGDKKDNWTISTTLEEENTEETDIEKS
jgi:hypothetical protein